MKGLPIYFNLLIFSASAFSMSKLRGLASGKTAFKSSMDGINDSLGSKSGKFALRDSI